MSTEKKAMFMMMVMMGGFLSYQGGVIMMDGQNVDGRCQRSATSFFIVGALFAENDARTQPARASSQENIGCKILFDIQFDTNAVNQRDKERSYMKKRSWGFLVVVSQTQPSHNSKRKSSNSMVRAWAFNVEYGTLARSILGSFLRFPSVYSLVRVWSSSREYSLQKVYRNDADKIRKVSS
jgi:hypothetical protein